MTKKAPKRIWAKMRQYRLVTDILGGLCFISAGLVGWLPGPGGMPLIYAGLRIMAINNPKAKQFYDYIIRDGAKLLDIIFPDHKIIAMLWDIVAVVIVVAAFYAMFGVESHFVQIAGSAAALWAVIAFFYNRKRYHRIRRNGLRRRAK